MSTADTDPCLPIATVSIRYLRRKLDEPAGRPIIRTVRGVGYQIPETVP